MPRALVLAAGQGTRLRPLTDTMPKCMVPMFGMSLLERQLATLRKAGITNICVVTGYCADKIEQLDVTTSHNARFAETNMVETMFSALDFIESAYDDLIISYGDIVYQSDNLAAVLACDDEIAIMVDSNWRDLWSLRLENPLDDAETLLVDANGYIMELGKKPDNDDQIQGQYTGLIKARADKIAELIRFYAGLDRSRAYDGATFENMYMTSFLQLLIDAGWKARAVCVNGGWLEVDSVEDLERYEALADKQELSPFFSIETW